MSILGAALNTWIGKNVFGLKVWEDYGALWCANEETGWPYNELPSYTSSTLEAMKALFNMRGKGYEWQIRTANVNSYTVSVWHPDLFEDGFYGAEVPTATSVVLPMAICLAIKAAMEHDLNRQ